MRALTVGQGIAVRDAALATRWIDRERFVQHNLSSEDGVSGLEHLISMLPGERGDYEVVRVFEEGPYVWTHSRPDIFGPKISFDVYRFEEGLIVEHWDNLASPAPANRSGRSAIDGPTEVSDLPRTEANKTVVQQFFETAFVADRIDQVDRFFDDGALLQHNQHGADGLAALRTMISRRNETGTTIQVDRVEKVLGQGNFVLLMVSVTTDAGPAGLFELFRVEDGHVAEHWDTLEPVPPRSAWQNGNGKF